VIEIERLTALIVARPKPAPLLARFPAMAISAQCLLLAQDELVPHACVRANVVDLSRWDGLASRQALTTQRLFSQMAGANVSPDLQLVPVAPPSW
jgi:hypothetical protein